ncbi:MAG TPA: hypothetical protein VGB18_08000 [Candidatus Thermoplasmatota archaeon]
MVVLGAFVNAGVTAFAGACYAFVGMRLSRRHQSRATQLFMALVALYLVLAALRQVAAGLENVSADRAIFLALLIPAGYSIVPLMVVVAKIRSEKPGLARLAMYGFLAAITIGLVFAFLGGITGPTTSDWGTDWRLNSPVARALIFLAMLLPGLVASIYLIRVGRKVGAAVGRRATLLGWSCGVFYVVFTADALALSGLALVLARVLTALAATLAYVAYARHEQADEAPETRGATQ